jgi:hypothetical protein
MASGRFRSLAAATVIATVVWTFGTPVATAGAVASWGGRVLDADRTPRAGVVVSLTGSQDGNTLRSAPTRTDGAFRIAEARAGSYVLRVESSEGVFVAPEPVRLEAGDNAPVALSLKSGPFHAQQEQGFGGAGASNTTKYIFAGVVTVAALFVIYSVTEDDDERPSSVF